MTKSEIYLIIGLVLIISTPLNALTLVGYYCFIVSLFKIYITLNDNKRN